MDLHAAAGYGALFLIAFRIAWGFIGTQHARFAAFAYSRRAILDYLRGALRGAPPHFTGHNPAGSWAVYALLAGTLVVCITGVAAIGAMFSLGPAPLQLGYLWIDTVRESHEWAAWILLGVIGVHIAGALWGSWLHRENLVAAMFTGRKVRHDGETREAPARALVAIAVIAGVVLLAAVYLRTAGWDDDYASLRGATRGPILATDAWQKDCAGCHLPYSPALLPRRSWERVLGEQSRHFGEDLSLNGASMRELLAIATRTPPPSWGAWKLGASIPADDAPLRITASPFWRHAHRNVPAAEYKPPVSSGRHDCEACHHDAALGIFHPRMIQKAATRIQSVKPAATLPTAEAYPPVPASTHTVGDLLKQYETQGASRFSATPAESLWTRAFLDEKSGEKRKCSLCHTEDLRRTGKHAVTGTLIEPLAPSANAKRLTDAEHVEKWFLRNCKWTLDRECTPQEKGDFLMMIRAK
jgi:cytochrome b